GDSPEAMKQAGIAYATEQILDLYANGVRNVHVFAMNKPDVAKAISENIRPVLDYLNSK
ncbi:MAG: methylenetetrahydrofolate reductase, partial [Megasphaera micronuciformis]|nr:methylenetetrahydrofolate reductase [Megasphaera micronuciformis]